MTTDQQQARAPAEEMANCCTGRVSRRMLEMAVQNEALANLMRPTGVELIRQASAAGFSPEVFSNCCHGATGRRPPSV